MWRNPGTFPSNLARDLLTVFEQHGFRAVTYFWANHGPTCNTGFELWPIPPKPKPKPLTRKLRRYKVKPTLCYGCDRPINRCGCG